jgi:hypothetical protein
LSTLSFGGIIKREHSLCLIGFKVHAYKTTTITTGEKVTPSRKHSSSPKAPENPTNKKRKKGGAKKRQGTGILDSIVPEV